MHLVKDAMLYVVLGDIATVHVATNAGRGEMRFAIIPHVERVEAASPIGIDGADILAAFLLHDFFVQRNEFIICHGKVFVNDFHFGFREFLFHDLRFFIRYPIIEITE